MVDKIAVDEAKFRLQNKSLDELLSMIKDPDTFKWTEAEIQAAKMIITERTSSAGIKVQDGHKGVKGWLMVFIVFIGVLLPIGAVSNISKWDDVSSVFNSYPGLQTLSVIDIAVSLIVSIFGIYTAIMLWKIKPGCVKLAKIFILVYAACSILVGIYMLSMDLPQSVKDSAIRWMVLRTVLAALWYLYFMKSKRVKATYTTEKM